MNIDKTEQRFIDELRHHLEGWKNKVSSDFSQKNFQKELEMLKSDELYSDFGFADEEYALIRLMGRMSISIGRRLGEIYDKIPRFAVQARYNLTHENVALKMGPEKLNLDIGIEKGNIHSDDSRTIDSLSTKYGIPTMINGIGIEIRYNFNPNDSSRLRKDVSMAKYLIEAQLTPIYLVFCTISPRDEAIKRLKNAGWSFLVGSDANAYMFELCGMDLNSILKKPTIEAEIKSAVNEILTLIYQSDAVKNTMLKRYNGAK